MGSCCTSGHSNGIGTLPVAAATSPPPPPPPPLHRPSTLAPPVTVADAPKVNMYIAAVTNMPTPHRMRPRPKRCHSQTTIHSGHWVVDIQSQPAPTAQALPPLSPTQLATESQSRLDPRMASLVSEWERQTTRHLQTAQKSEAQIKRVLRFVPSERHRRLSTVASHVRHHSLRELGGPASTRHQRAISLPSFDMTGTTSVVRGAVAHPRSTIADM